jgi:hypothetical protein
LGISSISYAKDKIKKPNVLLIMTDQQTADGMSCAGNKYLHTPAMDALAAEGISFTNNYVTQPLCAPFRPSLQTARYPHEINIINNSGKIPEDIPMWGNLMAGAGYDCQYFGKWHVKTTEERAGYREYQKGRKDDGIADLGKEFLEKKHEKPFFLTVSFVNPHNVCQLARANAVSTDLPDGPIGLSPTNMDELPPLPDNFNMPENEPAVIREIQKRSGAYHYPTADWSELTWSGKSKQSVYSDLVTNALDIPATILDAAGAEKPESMRGTSLLPLIYGKPVKKYDYVVSETMFARGSKNLGATDLASAGAITLSSCNSTAKQTTQTVDYSVLDEVLTKPVLKRELFPDPVIIETLELLRFESNFICRVRSTDGAEGISVGNNAQLQSVWPIFRVRLQPFFPGKDARDLEKLFEELYVYKSNYKLQNLALWVPLATIEFA